MPRSRTFVSRPVKRRTTTGCQTCRKRKIKCDELKPVCTQCSVRGLDCVKTASLKWEAEFLSRGLSFGRTGVWSKDPSKGATSQWSPSSTNSVATWCALPEIQAYNFLNLDFRSMTELSLGYVGTTEERSSVTTSPLTWTDQMSAEEDTSTPSLSPWLPAANIVTPRAPILSTSDMLSIRQQQERSLLLSYYIEVVCPMTVASSTSQSPFAFLLLPFAVTTSTLVMESILALAACHRSRSNPAYREKALQRSHGVLQALQGNLRTDDLWAVASNPETLAVMLLLCWFEIVNECDSRWVIHLKGARDLVRIRRQRLLPDPAGPAERQISNFCERFFAFQDVMGRTACGEDPVFGSDFWTSESTDCDPWLGCSTELVSILSKITEIGREGLSSRCTLQFQAAAASLEYQLANLKQDVAESASAILGQVAELKRLSAVLYLQCVLNGAGPSTPLVIEQVPKILRLVAVLLEWDVFTGINWPLFIAAVELDPDQDLQWSSDDSNSSQSRYARPLILQALNRLAGSTSNVSKTRSVIVKVWQARELDLVPRHEEGTEQNDWSRFVAPFCGNMSLA